MKSADGVHLQEKGLKNARFQVLFHEKYLPNIIKRPEKDLLFRPFYPARRRIQENRWRKWAHIPMISPKMSAGDKEKNKGLWSLAGPTLFAIYPACVRQAGRLAVFGLARRCWGLSGNTIQQFSLRRADGSAQFLQGTKKAGGIYNEGEGCRRKGGCYPALLASGESKAGQHRIVTEIFVCFRKPASGENSRRSGETKRAGKVHAGRYGQAFYGRISGVNYGYRKSDVCRRKRNF